MSDTDEHRRFDLGKGFGFPSKEQIEHVLQPLGDDGWEITYIGFKNEFGIFSHETIRWADARRPPYGSPAPSSWEYTGFNVALMPEPEWSNHIASRGWTKIRDIWYSYDVAQWFVFKRPDIWRGTDDGDILNILEVSFGFKNIQHSPTVDLPWMSNLKWRHRNEIVKEVLAIKWELSVQAKYDVGTYRAVEHWHRTNSQ